MPVESNNTDALYPGVNHPDCIVLHHSAYAPLVPQYELINGWHKARGFPLSTMGSYVGYHYLVEADGTVLQARNESEGGAHTIGKNWSSIGICLAGDFSKNAPTSEQVFSLARLMNNIKGRIPAITPDKIFPHRHFNDTECYGSHLKDDWGSALVSFEDPLDTLGLEINSMFDNHV